MRSILFKPAGAGRRRGAAGMASPQVALPAGARVATALAAALAVLAALVPALALAVGPPVRASIVLNDPEDVPIQGQPFAFTVRIVSSVDATAQDLGITSDRISDYTYAWDVVSIGMPPGVPVPLLAGQPLDVPCVMLPNEPTLPVTVALLYNGKHYGRQLGLLRRMAPRTVVPVGKSWRAPPVDAKLLPKATRPSLRKHEAPEYPKTAGEVNDGPRVSGKSAAYAIHVHGSFVYVREDNQYGPAFGCQVRVMNENVGVDTEMACGSVGGDGSFDLLFDYDGDEDPDVYLDFEATNGYATVEESDVWEYNFEWESGVMNDWTGTEWACGTYMPGDPTDGPALHILATATLVGSWYDAQGYTGAPSVDIQWPDNGESVSYYDPNYEVIHMQTNSQWQERTVAHEYSHHWMKHEAYYIIDDDLYCNAPARWDPPDDCGHGFWCQETATTAWMEGFPDWIGDFIARTVPVAFGLPALGDTMLEDVSACWSPEVSGVWDDPYLTEGNIGALLSDIEDSDGTDDDPTVNGMDWLALGPATNLHLAVTHQPVTPAQFIDAYLAEHPTAVQRACFWSTAKCCGFHLDGIVPNVVTNLTSTSHAVGVESADRTIDLTWTPAHDDMSGINGYSISVTANSPALPDTTEDIGDDSTYTTGILGDGSWYFNIRAHDRAGRWSSAYAHCGPFELMAPFEPDLRPWAYTGWYASLVPRPTNDASQNNVPVPPYLFGDSGSTYWNLSVQNIGEGDAPYGWKTTVYLDGDPLADYWLPTNLAAGNYQLWLNRGPTTICGGRHMLSVWTDPDDEHSEMNEFDNRDGRQWIWNPVTIYSGQTLTRASPPDATGGALTPLFLSYNCDGLRFDQSSGTYYTAISVRAVEDGIDYDCRFHPEYTSVTAGFQFGTMLGSSFRPVGCLDAVIARHDNLGASAWNVGIINLDEGWGDYVVSRADAVTLNLGSSYTVSLAADQYLALRQFQVLAAQGVSISLDVDPAAGRLQLLWLDNTFTGGGLLDFDACAATDENGHAEILCTAAAGWHGVVVFRDPCDVPAAKMAPAVSATVKVSTTPGDLTYNTPAGWYAPIVPSPAWVSTPTSVPVPDSLLGDAAATYLNMAWRNAGPTATGSYKIGVQVDAADLIANTYTSLAAGATRYTNQRIAQTVAAGRHTLAMHLDRDGQVAEISEANNACALQWVWRPTVLTVGSGVTRVAPPKPTAGWDDVVAWGGDIASYNCDGLRTPVPVIQGKNGFWMALATMPGASSDVDVRLHEVVSGTIGGFLKPRVTSGWGGGQSDFVIANFHVMTPLRSFDVGVLRMAGDEGYRAEAVASVYLADIPVGQYGPFHLSASHILNLHEVGLNAGQLAIELQNVEGSVDWGISLHRYDTPYQAKSSVVREGIRWTQGNGQGELLVVDVPKPGKYAVAVWKVGAADLAQSGGYTLTFTPGGTGTPETPPAPAGEALVVARPNPFNPRTAFHCHVPVAGHVTLGVYDTRGARVALLLDKDLPAGDQVVEWDGRDARGAAVPSGVYFARLRTAGGSRTAKVTLTK